MDKNFWARLSKAIKTAPDMRIPTPQSGYVPPARGRAYARLVGYFELGTHEEEYEGITRDREKVDLVFELSGPNHEPCKLEDGTLFPHRITVQETLSLDEDANFFRLFAAMNVSGLNTHMAQLLGDAFIVEVFHRRSKDRTKVYANLKGPYGYNVRGANRSEPVALPITEIKAFIWNGADREMWDSIYIPGEWEARKNETGEIISPARSKNVIQDKIRKAKNWPQHPLAAATLGPHPKAPIPEDAEMRKAADLKEWQEENWRRLHASLDEVMAKFHRENPTKQVRSKKGRSTGSM